MHISPLPTHLSGYKICHLPQEVHLWASLSIPSLPQDTIISLTTDVKSSTCLKFQMESYCFVSRFSNSASWLCDSFIQFISLHSWARFHSVEVPQFISPFVCGWALGLSPVSGYSEPAATNKYSCASLSDTRSFSRVRAWKRNLWAEGYHSALPPAMEATLLLVKKRGGVFLVALWPMAPSCHQASAVCKTNGVFRAFSWWNEILKGSFCF